MEHCGPNNDDHLGYRSKKYIKNWITNDPLKKIKRFDKKHLTLSEINNLESRISKEVSSAFRLLIPPNFHLKRFYLRMFMQNKKKEY